MLFVYPDFSSLEQHVLPPPLSENGPDDTPKLVYGNDEGEEGRGRTYQEP